MHVKYIVPKNYTNKDVDNLLEILTKENNCYYSYFSYKLVYNPKKQECIELWLSSEDILKIPKTTYYINHLNDIRAYYNLTNTLLDYSTLNSD